MAGATYFKLSQCPCLRPSTSLLFSSKPFLFSASPFPGSSYRPRYPSNSVSFFLFSPFIVLEKFLFYKYIYIFFLILLWIGIFAFSSNDIKVGANIEVDGAPWRVIGELANFTVTCYRISCWGFARIDFYACKLRKNGNSLSGELLFQFSTLSCTFKEV